MNMQAEKSVQRTEPGWPQTTLKNGQRFMLTACRESPQIAENYAA